jgi:hypothetical protein
VPLVFRVNAEEYMTRQTTEANDESLLKKHNYITVISKTLDRMLQEIIKI